MQEKNKLPQLLKGLGHRSALFCLDMEKECLSSLGSLKNRHFLIALSGGADSSALAMVFYYLKERHGFELSICHINHHLRPEAEEDEAFANKLAVKLEVPFYSRQLDTLRLAKNNSWGIEEAARKGRYALLETVRVQTGAQFILTGHHAGDLGEDILMRLARGSGWPALGGMKKLRGQIFRPFLHRQPEELRIFLKSLGQDWREDQSNRSAAYTRNRFRNEIMPLFARENPSFPKRICELNQLARLDEDFWQKNLEEKLRIFPWQEDNAARRGKILLSDKLLNVLHPAERLRLYIMALQRLRENASQPIHPRASTLLKLDQAYCSGQRNKLFQLPGLVQAQLEKNGICFSLKHHNE